jgi:hypothetical protein
MTLFGRPITIHVMLTVRRECDSSLSVLAGTIVLRYQKSGRVDIFFLILLVAVTVNESFPHLSHTQRVSMIFLTIMIATRDLIICPVIAQAPT